MVKLNPLKWFKGKEDQLTDQDHVYGSSAFAGSVQKPETDQESRRDLAINIHMIEDEGLIEQIQQFCRVPTLTPIYIEKLDNEGNVVERKIEKFQETYTMDYKMLALRFYLSKLIATRWIDSIDADIYKLKFEYNIRRLKQSLEPGEYKRKAPIYDAVLFQGLMAIDDAINGRKARLMKVQLRGFEVAVSHARSGQAPSGGMAQ